MIFEKAVLVALVISLVLPSCTTRYPCESFDAKELDRDTCDFKGDWVYCNQNNDTITFYCSNYNIVNHDTLISSIVNYQPCDPGVNCLHTNSIDNISVNVVKNESGLVCSIWTDVLIIDSILYKRDTIVKILDSQSIYGKDRRSWMSKIRIDRGLITEIIDTVNNKWRLVSIKENCDTIFGSMIRFRTEGTN